MAANFASFLLGHDYVTAAEIEEATQANVLYGGRLGTALIELGVITPEQLEKALSEFLDLPPILKEWLAKPDPAARAALHVDLVKKHRAFPLLFEKRTLHVGMVDPRNEVALDELAFASGCLIAPHALPEFRYVELMQRFYRVAPSARFRTLLDENHRQRLMRQRGRTREVQALERAKALDDLAIGPLAADVELTDAETFKVLHEQGPPRAAKRAASEPKAQSAPAPAGAAPERAGAQPALEIAAEPLVELGAAPAAAAPAAPASLAALEKIVSESAERSAVIDASLALAGRCADVAALFVVREGVAAGLCAMRAGQAFDVESTLIPLTGDGLMASCARERKPVTGLPSAALDKLLAKALRGEESAELAVFPVAIGERVVNLIVAQGASGGFSKVAAAALAALAPLLGAAYERLIRVQKSATSAAPAREAHAPAQPAPQRPEPAGAKPAAPEKSTIGAVPLRKAIVRRRAGDVP